MKKSILTVSSLLIAGLLFSQGGVGINNTGINPAPSAMLDVLSTDKGLLLPRVALTATNIATPVTLPAISLLVYNTASVADVIPGFYYWDGTQWVKIVSGAIVGTDDQDLTGATLTGSSLQIDIENGASTTVDLSALLELPGTATANQVLTWDGTNWIAQTPVAGADNWGTDIVNTSGTNISGDGTTANPITITEVDGDPNNEIQDLAINTTTNILTITNNGTPTNIDLSPYLDNTDDQNITGSSFNATTGDLVIGIENGTNQTLNLNGLKDHDWYEVGTTTAPDAITDNIFTQGNVGVGTATPLSKLDITSAMSLPLRLTSTTDPITSPNFQQVIGFFGSAGNRAGYIGDGTIGELIQIVGNNDYGISLQSLQPGAAIPQATIFLNPNSDTSIHFSTNNAQRMIIDPNGNVGIGISLPQSPLHIEGGVDLTLASGGFQIIGPTTGVNLAIDDNEIQARNNGGQSPLHLQADGGGLFVNFNQALSTRVTINNSGDMGVGVAPTEKLHVNGSVRIVDGTQGNRKILTSDATGVASWENGPVQEESTGAYKAVCSGSTAAGTGWVDYVTNGVYIEINTSGCGFTTTPKYFASIQGTDSHWRLTGVNAIYAATPTGFRIYLQRVDHIVSPTQHIDAAQCITKGYFINWYAIEN